MGKGNLNHFSIIIKDYSSRAGQMVMVFSEHQNTNIWVSSRWVRRRVEVN